jgi:ACR3 family arsenite efflux pump ArsB
MIFDVAVVVILIGAVFGGLNIWAFLKAALVIFVGILVLQILPATTMGTIVNGSKIYGVISPWALALYALLKPLMAKINFPAIKSWLINLAENAKALSPIIPKLPLAP